MQAHIDELCTITNQLINIDHPRLQVKIYIYYFRISNEDIAFTLLRNYLPSFHTSMVTFSYCIDELYMELLC
jgi:hypothetical protein